MKEKGHRKIWIQIGQMDSKREKEVNWFKQREGSKWIQTERRKTEYILKFASTFSWKNSINFFFLPIENLRENIRLSGKLALVTDNILNAFDTWYALENCWWHQHFMLFKQQLRHITASSSIATKSHKKASQTAWIVLENWGKLLIDRENWARGQKRFLYCGCVHAWQSCSWLVDKYLGN